jgi:hypothetical protein
MGRNKMSLFQKSPRIKKDQGFHDGAVERRHLLLLGGFGGALRGIGELLILSDMGAPPPQRS